MMEGTNISPSVDGLYYGFAISLVIFGMTVSQAWIYLHNNNDKWPLRLHISLLILLDIAEICCGSVMMHRYLIANFGNMDALSRPIPASSVEYPITGLIFFLVHMFFATRLLLLSKTWWIPSMIVSLSTAMLAVNIHTTVVSSIYHEFSDYRSRVVKIETAIFHALAAIIDIIVTFAFLWFLSKLKTEFKATRKVLHGLVVYSITRGLLTVAVQVAHLIMYFSNPGNLLFWKSLHFVVTGIYVITILVMLNSRPSSRDGMKNHAITDSFNFAYPDADNDPPDVPRSSNCELPSMTDVEKNSSD